MKVIELYHLSRNLQKIKQKRHLSNRQIAKGAKLSVSTISNWENLECEPTLFALTKLADYLNTSIDELVGHKLKK